jgi:hypothetical protein
MPIRKITDLFGMLKDLRLHCTESHLSGGTIKESRFLKELGEPEETGAEFFEYFDGVFFIEIGGEIF